MTYDQFINSKVKSVKAHGFTPTLPLSSHLFDWQKLIVEWAIKQGRCALFEECGLGKTLQQLEWARHVQHKTGGIVLILCPLSVAKQTIKEAVKFGMPVVVHAMQPEDLNAPGIYITNYERVEMFGDKLKDVDGIILDESSILKSFMGKTRMFLTDAFKETIYRLACTATPATNDYMEFGQHCEFLGVMPSNEMLSRWFINDTMNFGTYRLKGHAKQDFWKWVSTWAACVSKPSDIGFPDDGYDLPRLNMQIITVEVDETEAAGDELFRNPSMNATTIHKEMRLTCRDRVAKAAEIANNSNEEFVIWCNTNYEADELILSIKDGLEVRGNDKPEHKETKLNKFSAGEARVLITKPSIAGYGMNWQHCRNHIFVGLSYSFEDFYQAMRRGYRFGQQREFNCYVIQAATEGATLSTIRRKMDQHAEMQNEMKFAARHLANGSDRKLAMNTELKKDSSAGWTVYNGDCVRVAKQIESNSIDFSVYSPPFANLYVYSADVQDMGNCANQDEFFKQYRFLIKEKFRITKPGCLSAVHCKNLVKYANRDGAAGQRDFRGEIIRAHEDAGWVYHSEHTIWKDPVIEMQRTKAQGLLFKQLCQNSRFSRAGMADYIVVFRKWAPGMDEEQLRVGHDFSNQWEYFGSDGPAHFSDTRQRNIQIWQRYASPVWMDIRQTNVLNGDIARDNADEKHICPLQLDAINRLVWLYSKENDLVFSPFTGIGSEGYCAIKAGCKFIGAELKESYFKLACDHLRKAENEREDLFTLMKAS